MDCVYMPRKLALQNVHLHLLPYFLAAWNNFARQSLARCHYRAAWGGIEVEMPGCRQGATELGSHARGSPKHATRSRTSYEQ